MENENPVYTDAYKEEIKQKLDKELENIDTNEANPPIDEHEAGMRRIIFEESRKNFCNLFIDNFFKGESKKQAGAYTKESLQKEIIGGVLYDPTHYNKYEIYFDQYINEGIVPIRQPGFKYVSKSLGHTDFLEFLQSQLEKIWATEFVFESNLTIANKIEDGLKRLLFWKKRDKEYKQQLGYVASPISDYERQVKLEIDSLEEQINSQTKKPDKQRATSQSKSYTWLTKADQELPELYRKMTGQFIDQTTTLEQFKVIFTGQPIDKITPLNWIEAKNLLAYFIDQMKANHKVSISTNLWAIAKSCFNDASNLSQLKDLYSNNKNELPKNHNLIDVLFKTL